MIISILILIVGIALLIKGADFFIEGASAVARRFNIPSIIIGLTIVAMGTSAPEASVSINSALKGVSGVAIGNVLGSNIGNILLILGLTAIISNLTLRKNTIKFEMPFLLFITSLLCFMGYYFQEISRFSAFVLLGFFLLFFIYLFKTAKDIPQQEEEIKQLNPLLMVIFIIGGLFALVWGSDLTVNSAISIAKTLGISERIIGLTIVAIGTSLPELVTCVIAALKKQSDIAIGNIVGSNVFNILFVLGTTCAIQPVVFEKAFLFDGLVAIVSVILLWLFTFKDQVISRWDGICLFGAYVAYLIYIIIK